MSLNPTPRSILVVTVVHHPGDARIRHREIRALVDAGWRVTYAASFTGHGLPVPPAEDGLRCLDLPRAVGRHRLAAARAARRLLATEGPRHDLVLLHDPELLLAAAGVRGIRVVWDVHEDTAAAVGMKAWLPGPLRGPAAGAVRLVERVVERRLPLLLAEHAYAERFHRVHAVVPNTVPVPAQVSPPAPGRAVYLGNNSLARGARVLVEAGRLLRERTAGGCRVEVVGPADAAATRLLEAAHRSGDVVWHGFLPNDEALRLLDGALVGLSLLQDRPNYRHSMPTKVVEYMGLGLPVVTTPLPLAVGLVERAGCGTVVPFDDPEAVASAVLALHEDPDLAVVQGSRGRAVALADYDWRTQADGFVGVLEALVLRGGGPDPRA